MFIENNESNVCVKLYILKELIMKLEVETQENKKEKVNKLKHRHILNYLTDLKNKYIAMY